MANRKKHSKQSQRASQWLPPKGAAAYFNAASDEDFKRQHPIGYFFLVLLGIAALLGPVAVYMIYTVSAGYNSPWMLLGWVGAFIFGIGLFNFVSLLIGQYLGHGVSVLAFVLGSFLVAVSLYMLG